MGGSDDYDREEIQDLGREPWRKQPPSPPGDNTVAGLQQELFHIEGALASIKEQAAKDLGTLREECRAKENDLLHLENCLDEIAAALGVDIEALSADEDWPKRLMVEVRKQLKAWASQVDSFGLEWLLLHPGRYFLPLPKRDPCESCGEPEGIKLDASATGYSVGNGFLHKSDCAELRCPHGVLWIEECAACDQDRAAEGED